MPKFLRRKEWAAKVEAGEQMEEFALRKYGGCEVVKQEVDPATGMTDVTFVISTEAQDRDDDIISAEGWDLDNYLKNPVVLWAHDYGRPPVGRSQKVWVDEGRLLSTDRFTPQEVNPFGHMVYQMVRGGFLKATSVGFRPREYVYNDDHKGYDFITQEKLEHSIVPVPANPEALVAASAAGIDLNPMKEWAEIILDRDPEADAVALWLPKETITTVHRALSNVAVSLIDTGTSDSSSPDNVVITTTGGTALGNGDSVPWADPVSTPVTPTVADLKINIEPSEDVMEEAIQALSDVVKELREALETLPDQIGAAVEEKVDAALKALTPEPPTEPEPDPVKAEDGEDMDEEDVRAIIKAAAEEIRLATTGQLPE